MRMVSKVLVWGVGGSRKGAEVSEYLRFWFGEEGQK